MPSDPLDPLTTEHIAAAPPFEVVAAVAARLATAGVDRAASDQLDDELAMQLMFVADQPDAGAAEVFSRIVVAAIDVVETLDEPWISFDDDTTSRWICQLAADITAVLDDIRPGPDRHLQLFLAVHHAWFVASGIPTTVGRREEVRRRFSRAVERLVNRADERVLRSVVEPAVGDDGADSLDPAADSELVPHLGERSVEGALREPVVGGDVDDPVTLVQTS